MTKDFHRIPYRQLGPDYNEKLLKLMFKEISDVLEDWGPAFGSVTKGEIPTAGGGTLGVTDHGNLFGLADDDHAQYLLLDGRGGQTINDDITLVGPTSGAQAILIQSGGSNAFQIYRGATPGGTTVMTWLTGATGGLGIIPIFVESRSSGNQAAIFQGTGTTGTLIQYKNGSAVVTSSIEHDGSWHCRGIDISNSSGTNAVDLYTDAVSTLKVEGASGRVAKMDFASITAATVRTYTWPDATGTIALAGSPGVPSTWGGADATVAISADGYFSITHPDNAATGAYMIDLVNDSSGPPGNIAPFLRCRTGGLTYLEIDSTGGLKALAMSLLDPSSGFTISLTPAENLTVDRVIGLYDEDGDIVVGTRVSAALYNLNLGTNSTFRASTSGTGASFRDNTTSTKRLRMVLSGATGNNAFVIATPTVARTYTFGDDTGTMAAIVAPASATVDKTGQTATIAATTAYTTVHAGFYRMTAYWVFTAVTLAGSLTVTAHYTDPQQAQANAFINAAAFAAAGSFAQGSCVFYATSGSVIQFSTTLVNTGTYNVYVRVESLT